MSSLTEQVVLRLLQLVRRDTKKGFLGPGCSSNKEELVKLHQLLRLIVDSLQHQKHRGGSIILWTDSLVAPRFKS